ncbi:porin [Enterobacteriaceae bacterium LUAb1]
MTGITGTLKISGLLFFMFFPVTNARGYDFINTIKASQFLKDSHLDLTLRNRAKYLNENETGETFVHTAWSQSTGLDYQSGYFMDIIGADISYINVSKLAASNYFASRALLWNDGPGFKSSNAKSYKKFTQRNIKIHLGDDDSLSFNGRYGWQTLKNYTILTGSYEASKNSYLGYTGTVKYKNISADTLYITSETARDSPDKRKLQSKNKKTIDHIAAMGINYNAEKVNLSYNYGYAKDYLDRHAFEASYLPDKKLTFDAVLYANIPLTIYKSMPSESKTADNNAWHYAAGIKWQEKNMGLKFVAAYTDASKNDGRLGHFDRHPVKGPRWRLNTMTSAAYHYQRNHELGLVALADYKYSDEFYSAIQFNYGQFNYKNNNFQTGEINLINAWRPAAPGLKNLTIFSTIGRAWTYETNNHRKQPVFDDNGRYIRRSAISADIIFDYKFNVF